MAERLDQLMNKVDEVLLRLEKLKAEKLELEQENRDLRQQVSQLQHECDALKLKRNDQVSLVRSKLSSMLNRVEELEKAGF